MVGSQSLLLVLGVVLLLFGGKKLPELAGSLGRSMKEFKKAVDSGSEEAQPAAPESRAAVAAPAPRACAACQAPVEAEWTHCSRCGASVAPTTTPTA